MQNLIDLHCHILPGIDDGAADLAISLDMAHAFVDDGVTHVACTPHIFPGLYQNTGPQIRRAVQDLQGTLKQQAIPLCLVVGADNHVAPDFVASLQRGHLLALADSRYVLVEPPHHVAPPRLEEFFFTLMAAGYTPILTHPERLSWIKTHYATIERLVHAGVWMQVTAGSLTGGFGRTARYYGEKLLDEGRVHILATDAHDTERRPPNLGKGRELAAARVGAIEAEHLVLTRPRGVLSNVAPSSLPLPAVATPTSSDAFLEASSRDGSGNLRIGPGRDNVSGLGDLGRRLRRIFE